MNNVSLTGKFNEEYVKLNKRADCGDGESEYLLKLVDKGIAKLAEDLTCGVKIPKRLWPKEYVTEYGINNLWKLNLDSYWRMIYTIVGDQAQLIGIILEVLDHKKYDRKFGYKTS
ncbi:MAG: hypothetical protein V1875_04980 [Candidatus Altiarchaeota archaeon]